MANPGAAFRNRIAALLRTYYTKVEVEVRIGATTADVLYVDDTQSVFPRTIAIEAKDWSTPLTSADIAEIYHLYLPALTSRQIDYLWIVGNHPLAGSPRQTVDGLRHVAYSTFESFQASLINFQPILAHNIDAFENDDTFDAFVETRARGSGEPLIASVEEWLTTDKPGLVIYGGYGLGKSTFSKYLAHKLSKKFVEHGSGRIPVRFTLGDIFYKQDLVALVSSTLAGGASGVVVKNFQYPVFREINKAGSLLLIFDGFDEMRHAMDLEDFVFNFQEMRSLLTGAAKVIILGRPDAFLSSSEELRILSSLFENPRHVDEKLALKEVAFFSDEDIRTYLDRFMQSRRFNESKMAQVTALLKMMPADEQNILSRPVQLKMFAEVIDDFIGGGEFPTRYNLYESFIYKFSARENSKSARVLPVQAQRLPGQDDRARFMQNVAWWILNTKKENRFVADEIPHDLVPEGMRGGGDSSVREALLGSVVDTKDHKGVLDRKTNRYYFFPHKSYIEFLVAQYFSYANFSTDVYREFIQNVSPEIVSFIEEGPPTGIDNLRLGISHARGEIPLFLAEAAANANSIAEEIARPGVDKSSPVEIYTYYLHLRQRGKGLSEFLRRQITLPGNAARIVALTNCSGNRLGTAGDMGVARTLVTNFLTSVFEEHKLKEFLQSHRPLEIYREDELAVKAGAMLEAITLRSDGVVLIPDRLVAFAIRSAGADPYVELGGRIEHPEIFLSREFLTTTSVGQADPSLATIQALLDWAEGIGGRTVPILLKGGAERRYSA